MNVLPPQLDRYAVSPVTGCWEWQGARDRRGYGRVSIDGLTRFAHGLMYLHHVGPVPDGLELDHLCRNPPCCNPAHLEPVTHAENIRRGAAPAAVKATWDRLWKDRTHCSRGHDLAEQGIATAAGHGYTTRACRACRREDGRRYRARQKENA